jgi:hypothetical protein
MLSQLKARGTLIYVSNPTPEASGAPKKRMVRRKKKKKPSGPIKPVTPPLSARIAAQMKVLGGHLKTVKEGLKSPDSSTQRMAILFYVSIGLFFVILASGIYLANYSKLQKMAMEAEKKAHEAATHQQLEALKSPLGEEVSNDKDWRTMNLGTFNIELNLRPGEKPTAGMANIAEIEVYVECDPAVSCPFLVTNRLMARDQVISLINALEKEEIMSPEGKKLLKKRIQSRLNSWLAANKVGTNKVRKIFFTRLIIG